MMRFIIPIILIGITGASFLMFTDPIYKEVSALNLDVASYDGALDNSKNFKKKRDELTYRYNDITIEDINKLKKLLPDNVDNIRLILEIEQIALPYGMILKDVKYNTSSINTNTESTQNQEVVIRGGSIAKESKDYGTFDLEFSVSGTYDNFMSFTKDLESNLRIVDISSIAFSSSSDSASSDKKTNSPEIYKYNFKIKTYWLKN